MFGIVDAYAQGVSPPKNGAVLSDPNPVKLIVAPQAQQPTISGTFVAAVQGRYQFALQGAGGIGGLDFRGGPGGLAIRVAFLTRGQNVAYTVSAGNGLTTVTSSVSLPDRVLSVTSGGDDVGDGNAAGGVATGGDINISGVAGGSQAASYGAFIGGVTNVGNSALPVAPGGPGAGGGGGFFGGPGRLIITYVGP